MSHQIAASEHGIFMRVLWLSSYATSVCTLCDYSAVWSIDWKHYRQSHVLPRDNMTVWICITCCLTLTSHFRITKTPVTDHFWISKLICFTWLVTADVTCPLELCLYGEIHIRMYIIVCILLARSYFLTAQACWLIPRKSLLPFDFYAIFVCEHECQPSGINERWQIHTSAQDCDSSSIAPVFCVLCSVCFFSVGALSRWSFFALLVPMLDARCSFGVNIGKYTASLQWQWRPSSHWLLAQLAEPII